ncbi:DUF1320 domain-containing protein [Sphingomonas paucimobilis]|uniref:DUF1320 domain-containing protein n=1 Tax=Sphingomonas paucimobilis TaxID=13689 RepID=UPI001966775D|nr:DUF1320 domain-containing protein [Sphingomonas paucimobilis]QRY97380.1 DUF1320 domain-containing protein [Sphingomonas paucimobilis]
MTYATLDMLKGAFGEANLISATDRSGTGSIDVSAVERALSGADATIDAALAVRYRLPLAVVPTIVSEIAVSIALYKLHVFAPDQKVKDDHDRALKDWTGSPTAPANSMSPASSRRARALAA